MRIITKYLCKEFFKLLTLCQTVFISLYLIIDFTQKVDDFIEAHASNAVMLMFFLCKIPLITVQMAPVAALISVIVLFSLMKKNNEVTALKASGVSVTKFSVPLLVASMGLSIAVFLFSELVVPFASEKSNDIWIQEVKKKRNNKRFYNRSNIWFRSTNTIYWIRHFDGKRMVMEQPSFYFFDDSFRLIKRIDAQKATWVGNKWKIEQGIIQQKGDAETFGFEQFNEMDMSLPEDPDTFLKIDKHPEEMSYWELRRHAKKTSLGGFDDTRFVVDQHVKLAFPLLNFIMILVGIPIALNLKKGGTPVAVSLGIAVCFVYLIVHAVMQSLGYASILPPIMSAWFTNITFLLFGWYLLMRVET